MGAGYSGLRQMTTVRPTYMKLDRSLIRGIDADPDRGALISALLGYARQTGGHLIAEGVETEAELAALTALGVELVQGFHVARPGSPWPRSDLRAERAEPAERATPAPLPPVVRRARGGLARLSRRRHPPGPPARGRRRGKELHHVHSSTRQDAQLCCGGTHAVRRRSRPPRGSSQRSPRPPRRRPPTASRTRDGRACSRSPTTGSPTATGPAPPDFGSTSLPPPCRSTSRASASASRRMTAATGSAPAARSSCTSRASTTRGAQPDRRGAAGQHGPYLCPAPACSCSSTRRRAERQLIWVRARRQRAEPGQHRPEIHPGKALTEGHTYIVALR